MEEISKYFQNKNLFYTLLNLIYGTKANFNKKNKNLNYILILEEKSLKKLKIIHHLSYLECIKLHKYKKFKIKDMKDIKLDSNFKISFIHNKKKHYFYFSDIEITKSIFYSLNFLKIKIEKENIFDIINNNIDSIKLIFNNFLNLNSNQNLKDIDEFFMTKLNNTNNNKNHFYNDFKYFLEKNFCGFQNIKNFNFNVLAKIILENNLIDKENDYINRWLYKKNKFPKLLNKFNLFIYFNSIFFYGINLRLFKNNLMYFDYINNYNFKGIDMTRNHLNKDYKFSLNDIKNIIINNYKVIRINLIIENQNKILTDFYNDEDRLNFEYFIKYINSNIFINNYFPFFIILKINKNEYEINIDNLFNKNNYGFIYLFKSNKYYPKLYNLFYKVIIILEFKENDYEGKFNRSLKSSESLKRFSSKKKIQKKFSFNFSNRNLSIFKSIDNKKNSSNFYNESENISRYLFKVLKFYNIENFKIPKINSIIKLKSIKKKLINYNLLKKNLKNKISFCKPLKDYKEKNNIFNYLNIGISVILIPFKTNNNIYEIFNHCFYKINNEIGIVSKLNIKKYQKKLAIKIGILKALNLKNILNNSKVCIEFYLNSKFIKKSKPIIVFNNEFNFSEYDILNNILITDEEFNIKLNNENYEFLQILIKDYDFNINYYMNFINISNWKWGYSIFEIYNLKDENFKKDFGLIYLNIN